MASPYKETLGKRLGNWWSSGTPESFENSKALKAYQNVGLPVLAIAEAIATQGRSPGTAALKQQEILYGAQEQAKNRKAEFEKQQREATQAALTQKVQEKTLAELDRKSIDDAETKARQKAYREKLGLGGEPANAAEQQLLQEDPAGYLDYQLKKKVAEANLNKPEKPDPFDVWQRKEDAKAARKAEEDAKKGEKKQKLTAPTVKEINSRKQMASVLDDLANEFQKTSDVLSYDPRDIAGGNVWVGNPRVKELNRKLQSTNQKIAKLLEEGRMTDADRAFYLKTLPKLGENAESIQRKLNGMREYAINNYNMYLDDMNAGNFDVSKFVPQEFVPIELTKGTGGKATTKSANSAPAPKVPKKDEFTVGQVYTDDQGNSATYMGNGQWKEMGK